MVWEAYGKGVHYCRSLEKSLITVIVFTSFLHRLFNRFILRLLFTGSLKANMLTKSGFQFNQLPKKRLEPVMQKWPTPQSHKKNPWPSIHIFRWPCELRELPLSHHTQDLIPIHTIERLDVLGSAGRFDVHAEILMHLLFLRI